MRDKSEVLTGAQKNRFGLILYIILLSVVYILITRLWICPYISRHLLSLNPLLACCRRYSRGER
nr:hypothetical protein ODIPHBHE_00083 [Escherichia coli]